MNFEKRDFDEKLFNNSCLFLWPLSFSMSSSVKVGVDSSWLKAFVPEMAFFLVSSIMEIPWYNILIESSILSLNGSSAESAVSCHTYCSCASDLSVSIIISCALPAVQTSFDAFLSGEDLCRVMF